MNTDTLHTMRDEMAYEYKRLWKFAPNQNCAEFKRLARWLATLDAYLAVPRCPECGTHVQPIREVEKFGNWVCLSCQGCGFTSGFRDTEADALAAFYEATP